MEIHPVASAGFRAGAEAYERGRPSYAAEATQLLADLPGVGPHGLVVDVGAGTGKWTSGLVTLGATTVAVEPVPTMRDLLRKAVPEARPLAATAEALPLQTGCADLVTMAAAVHWFNLPLAVPELVRVLRPGGHLAVLRNRRDHDVPWVRALDALLDPHRTAIPTAARVGWREALTADARLEPVAEASFDNPQLLDVDQLVARVSSHSYIAALPEAARSELIDEVVDLVKDLPMPLTMPYSTEIWLLRRDSNPEGRRSE